MQIVKVCSVSLYGRRFKRYLRVIRMFVTLVVGDPAVSFSMNRGIAMGPNAGVAARQALLVG